MQSTLALLMVLAAFAGVEGQTLASYAALCADHTMVKYPGTGPTCKPLITSGVTTAEIAQILTLHNNERSKVALGLELRGVGGAQPKASNMKRLAWDAELAKVAQRWAVQCTFGHDACRKVARFAVGQNAYISMSTSTTYPVNWPGAVNAWINEVAVFNKSNITPFAFTSGTGHYTQVAWAKTSLVGCGRAVFKDAANPTYIKQLYVCNYGEAGNVVGLGTPMYLLGTPCTQCAVAGCLPSVGLCP